MSTDPIYESIAEASLFGKIVLGVLLVITFIVMPVLIVIATLKKQETYITTNIPMTNIKEREEARQKLLHDIAAQRQQERELYQKFVQDIQATLDRNAKKRNPWLADDIAALLRQLQKRMGEAGI